MGRIVVAIDGSEAARKALAWALDEGRLRQAVVEVVHAWDVPYVGMGSTIAGVLEPDAFEEAGKELLDRAVDAAETSDLPEPPVRRLVRGLPASAVLEAAAGADLVVVGSRGRGGFTGLLLGSVSQQVAHHAPCPVVIVPHDGD